jgi:DNA-binding CsgD family transcriptional regulator
MRLNIKGLIIDVSHTESRQGGRLDWAGLGYGLQQAWMYSVMFDKNVTTLYGGTSSASFSSLGIATHLLISIVVFSITLFCMGLFEKQTRRLFINKKTPFVAAALIALGTIILMFPMSAGASGVVIPCASGLLTGVGSALFLIIWGMRFSWLDNDSIVINAVVAFVVGFFLYGLIVQPLPLQIEIIIAAILPLLELVVWQVAAASTKESFHPFEARAYLPLKKTAVFGRFGIPVALFGVVLGLLRAASTGYLGELNSFGTTITIVLTVCAAALVTMVLYVTLAEPGKWNSVFRPLIPCVAVAIFCIPFMTIEAYSLTALLVVAGFVLLESMMWIYFGFITQKFNLSPVLIYGIGRGTLALFSLFGSAFWGCDTEALWGAESTIKVSATLMLLVFAYVTLPSRTTVERMRETVLLPKRHASSFECDDIDLEDAEEGEDDVEIRAEVEAEVEAVVEAEVESKAEAGAENKVEAKEIPNQKEKMSQSEVNSQAAADPFANSKPEVLLGQGKLSHTPGVSHVSSGASLTTPSIPLASSGMSVAAGMSVSSSMPTPASMSAPANASASFGTSASFGAPSVAPLAHPVDKIPQQVEVIANTYLLSRREVDVLECLARGRNASYICKHLYIAEGTAKTHIRHIYRKLNVHSQPELIELVEEVEA